MVSEIVILIAYMRENQLNNWGQVCKLRNEEFFWNSQWNKSSVACIGGRLLLNISIEHDRRLLEYCNKLNSSSMMLPLQEYKKERLKNIKTKWMLILCKTSHFYEFLALCVRYTFATATLQQLKPIAQGSRGCN